jgi:hypothetical protein
MPAWQQIKFSPQLLDRLAAWREAFEAGIHCVTGWRSPRLQNERARRPENPKPQFARNWVPELSRHESVASPRRFNSTIRPPS